MAFLSPDIWTQHIQSWQQSGMTQAQYCREHHLSDKSFYYWKTKLSRTEKTATKTTRVTAGFAVARIEQTAPAAPLSVSLPGGVTIHDVRTDNLSTALTLLEALR